MPEDLLGRVKRQLGQAFLERWSKARDAEAVLDEDTHFDRAAGGLVGGVTFFLTARDGRRVAIHRERMGVLRTGEEVDDWLARALSIFLYKHPTWPT